MSVSLRLEGVHVMPATIKCDLMGADYLQQKFIYCVLTREFLKSYIIQIFFVINVYSYIHIQSLSVDARQKIMIIQLNQQ